MTEDTTIQFNWSEQGCRDEMEDCLYAWYDAMMHWRESAIKAAELETRFKAWQAARKTAYIAAKYSAVQSDAKVQSEDEWSERYLESQKANIAAETQKRIMGIAEAKWKTEQTRQVSLRAVK